MLDSIMTETSTKISCLLNQNFITNFCVSFSLDFENSQSQSGYGSFKRAASSGWNLSRQISHACLSILRRGGMGTKLEMSVFTKRITPNSRLTGVSSVSIDELLDADKGRSSIIMLHLQKEVYRSAHTLSSPNDHMMCIPQPQP